MNLESERSNSMNTESVSKHFFRVTDLSEEHNINELSRIFNLGETSFSIRGMTFGSSKWKLKKGYRENARELKFNGTVDQVTLMPVLYAAGQALTPFCNSANRMKVPQAKEW